MSTEISSRVHPEKWRIASHVLDLETSIIREILKISSQPGVISFAGGLPAPELFPLDDLKTATMNVLDKYGADSIQYSLSSGIVPFRELLVKRAIKAGVQSDISNILVTSGSQQGIELTARAFIDPGDYILTENPTYVGALQAFDYYQARYVTVDMDDDGMIVDQVADKMEKFHPKLIYTVSNFQNPTGVTMSEERRRQLMELAAGCNIPIVDDNPYGDIRFSGEPMPSLKSLGGDVVIELRTISKTIAPGFRIGWMNGPAKIIAQFEKVKQCADLHTSNFGQYVIYEYMRNGLLEPHIEKIREDCGGKRSLMLKTMEETFPPEIEWTRPEGGLFLWVKLPSHMSGKDLLPKAINVKVAYVYGEPFYPNDGGKNTLRLNFSNATHDEIIEGITRLGKLFSENI